MIKKIILAVLVLLPSAWIYTVSWQYGMGLFVLLICLVTMGSLIRGSVQVVREPRGRSSQSITHEEQDIPHSQNTSQNVGGVSGLDSSVFERFHNQHNVGGTTASRAAPQGPYQSPADPGYVTENNRPAALQTEEKTAFLDELEDTEQVRVSLSSEAKTPPEPVQREQAREPVRRQFEEEPLGTGFMKGASSSKPIPGTTPYHHPSPPVTKTIDNPSAATGSRLQPGNSVENAMPNDELDKAMENLFEDVRIPLKAEQSHPDSGRQESGPAVTEKIPIRPQPSQDFMNEEDFSQLFQKPGPLGEHADVAEGLLKLAISSAEAGKQDEARTGLNEYMSIIEQVGEKPDPEALRLERNLRLPEMNGMEDETHSNLVAEQELADSRMLNDQGGQTDYATIIDELVGALEEKQAFEEALPLLHDLLSYNRQQSNAEGMDRLYQRIERALKALGDEEQLIRMLEEHLELKKDLGEKQGESMLLEALGTSYANAGNLEMSRRYHQENRKIQAELKEKSAVSAGEPALQ